MAAQGFPGRPFPNQFINEYPQPEYKDPRAVAAQLENLNHGAQKSPWQRELVRFQQDRRVSTNEQNESSLPPMKFLEDDGAQLFLFPDLLVRTDDFKNRTEGRSFNRTPMWKILQPYKLTDELVDGLEGTVTRLYSDSLDVDRLSDIAQILRHAGYRASLDFITPLGPIVKGQAGAEPAETTPGKYPPAWAATEEVSKRKVTVAIIDTGITVRTDGWLDGIANDDNVDPLDAFPIGDPDGYLDFMAGHGTFCAGIVAQVAPRVRITAFNPISSDGIGSDKAVAKAMLQAAEEGSPRADRKSGAVTIINLSLGTETVDDQPPVAMEAALEILARDYPNTLVVAAAGNGGTTRPVWPAAFRSVVSVAALTANSLPAAWSNHGFWVDCATIGEGILSTYVTGQESVVVDPYPDTFGENSWARWSGTSFAAPQIAGAVAKFCQRDDINPQEAVVRLFAKGVAIPDYGHAFELLPGV